MENIHDPRIKLLIVGSPFFGRTQQSPFLRKLEQQAETLGDRVRFTGYVPNDSMPEYYRLADLVCVPTLVEEAAGLVAVEAMGCGRPVLATRSGGMPEYLDGSQAVLVDRDGNVAGQLSFAIRMLYEHPDLRAQMSTAGAKTAQRYSSARFYDDFVRIVYDLEVTYGTARHLCDRSGIQGGSHPAPLHRKCADPAAAGRAAADLGGRSKSRPQRRNL